MKWTRQGKKKHKDIYNQQNYTQTSSALLNITRTKIDEKLDTITLNNFWSGFRYRDNNYNSSREQGKGARNNSQINRAGFDDSSQGGRNKNNQSNTWNHKEKLQIFS